MSRLNRPALYICSHVLPLRIIKTLPLGLLDSLEAPLSPLEKCLLFFLFSLFNFLNKMIQEYLKITAFLHSLIQL